jgi:hypothetical protein
MCNLEHKYRDLKKIESTEQLDFHRVRGSIRMSEGRVVLPKESEKTIHKAKKIKF